MYENVKKIKNTDLGPVMTSVYAAGIEESGFATGFFILEINGFFILKIYYCINLIGIIEM